MTGVGISNFAFNYTVANFFCCAVLGLLGIWSLYTDVRIRDRQVFWYYLAVGLQVAYCAADCVWSHIYDPMGAFPRTPDTLGAVNVALSLLLNAMVFSLFVFFLVRTQSRLASSRRRIVLCGIPMAVASAVMLLVGIFAPSALTTPAAERTTLYNVLFLLPPSLYGLASVALALRAAFRRENRSVHRWYLGLACYPVLMAVAGVCQELVMQAPLICYATTLGLVFIYASLVTDRLFTDSVTGLPNRMALRRYVSRLLRDSQPTDGLHLIVLKLDTPKDADAHAGRAPRDDTVRLVAQGLQNATRSMGPDCLFRYSTNRFVIVSRLVERASVQSLIMSCRTHVARLAYDSRLGHEPTLLSGDAPFQPELLPIEQVVSQVALSARPEYDSAPHDALALMQRIDAAWNHGDTDPKTGLHDMTAVGHAIDAYVAELPHNAFPEGVAVVYLDISRFKAFNIRHGFEEGDKLLRQMAEAIRIAIGDDHAARDGADRFYLVVGDANAEWIVQSVHDAMRAAQPWSAEIRAGIYTLAEDDTSGRAVDRAKIAADSTQGDLSHYWRRYDDRMENALKLNAYVVSRVDKAIEQGWAKVFYQPVVDTLSGKVCCMEALSRWDDPNQGFLSPAEFIQPLEEAHLLARLDLNVLDHVCEDLAEQMAHDRTSPSVSVNLSRHDLAEEDIHDRINQALDRRRIPHHFVHFEITESALVRDHDSIGEHIARFHADGYQVWLDDFGSGYSSLNSLQEFDIDCIKIDMGFMRASNEKTPAILRDIVDMAKRLGMLTLAEGVETREQFEFLREIGCLMVQGYYISKPRPKEELMATLAERNLHLETQSERELYFDIGRSANVLDAASPLATKTTSEQEEQPVLIVVAEDQAPFVVYSNRAARAQLAAAGISSVAETNERLAKGQIPYMRQLRDAALKAVETGKVSECLIELNGKPRLVRVQLICAHKGARAFVLH